MTSQDMLYKGLQERINEIQTQVGLWSLRNFGNQVSKVNSSIVLGSRAPLLGLLEEFLEWETALTPVDSNDAIADMFIYLCDYTYRRNIRLGDHLSSKQLSRDLVSPGLLMLLQENHPDYDSLSTPISLGYLLGGLLGDKPLETIEIIGRIWNDVSQRNWKSNPEDAHVRST